MLKRIQAARVRISALKREQNELKGLWVRSRAEVAELVRRHVSAFEQEARETCRRALQELAGGHHAAILQADVFVSGSSTIASEADLGPMLVAMLGADKITSVLLADIGAVPEGLPRADRLARLAAIAAELDTLEAEEEALIVASEATAAPVPRRPDARPSIVLGTPDKPEPKAAPQERAGGDVFGNVMSVPSPYVGSSRP
jgi:hypothetical protein